MWLQLFAAFAFIQVYVKIQLYFGYREYARYTFPSDFHGYFAGDHFSCGEIKNISYPFKLQGSDSPGFELICHHNTNLLINITLYHDPTYSYRRMEPPRFEGIYHVKKINIDYSISDESTIQIADSKFGSFNDSASSICLRPPHPLPESVFDELWSEDPIIVTWVRCSRGRRDEHLDPEPYLPLHSPDNNNNNNNSFSSSPATYLILPCPDNDTSSMTYLLLYSYGNSITVEQLHLSCQTVASRLITHVNNGDLEGLNLTSTWSHLKMGFAVRASNLCHFCDKDCPLFCDVGSSRNKGILEMIRHQLIWMVVIETAVFGMVPRFVGILFLAGFLIYKLKNKYSPSDNIEKVLQKYQHLMPRRYSYPEIKIITRHFSEKLGQGGFGSVFKGSLFDGHPVAVKLLGKTKDGGLDFMNEVATIGRIHHVNIVRLLGFCSEGKTRALVYEFMPNGSLEKYISPSNGISHLLSWEKLYKIALGIAHGIEYLHQGCDMCILHFDIKPHNVLLDENFCPKISDFGLAKLSPTPNTMTLSGYRGTPGYIAPEQVARNFGGVSSKSDVYSFGMLLLQMAGRAKNNNVLAPASSKFYLPKWIYDQMSEGGDLEIGEAIEVDVEIVKKLVLVGLCCIQMMPAYRPSIGQVVGMLEGSLDTPQLPPKPFFMFPEACSQECSALSICQNENEIEEVTSLLGMERSTSSSLVPSNMVNL